MEMILWLFIAKLDFLIVLRYDQILQSCLDGKVYFFDTLCIYVDSLLFALTLLNLSVNSLIK